MFGRVIKVRAQHPDRLVQIGLHRQVAHQRPQHGLGVDIDARRRLESVGDA